MNEFVPILAIGIAASVGLTPLTRQLAQRIGLVDKPSARKVHRVPTPLMGGLAIYLAFVLALLMYDDWQPYAGEFVAIVIAATWLCIVGFVDDRRELSPRLKFASQFAAAFLVSVAGLRVELFGSLLPDMALTLFWYVGITNAINFLDNMDGLCAGVSAIAAFFIFLLASAEGDALVATLSAALCGAVIGFLIYNFNPASMFMGDMGSLVLGFLLAVLGLKLTFPTQVPQATWMIPILVLGMPIFDTSLVVFTRLREGRSPMQAGKDHTSHRLVALGLHPRVAVIALYGACLSFGGAAILISTADLPVALGIGAAALVISGSAFALMMAVRARQIREIQAQPER